jgi:curved DNA-binding protein CbpA
VPVAEQMDMERAYRVLGVPSEASARAIKQAHRKLVKRWHPDLYKAGTPEYSDATEMTRLMNAAYSTISHAPLRYQRGFSPAASYRRERQSSNSTIRTEGTLERPLPRLDRIEFWTRFVCGALLGLFFAADLAVSGMSDATKASVSLCLIGSALVIAAFGFLSASCGDRFWRSVLLRWSRWVF